VVKAPCRVPPSIPISSSCFICHSEVCFYKVYYPNFYLLIQLVISVPPPSQHQMALVSSLPIPTSTATKEKDHPPSPLISSSPQPPSTAHLSDTPSSAPGPGAVSESRRRNAEQRAAQLRADPLLAQVEPHRVFCALCRKWVQLRQDSTFCAYPWQQHRSKCVIRQLVASFFFFQICARISVPQRLSSPPFFFPCQPCSDKKTKAVAGGSMSHSGCVTPASGDESTENGELGPEGEELDTAEDADGVPDAHAADSHAPRFTHLGSSADRYAFPLPHFILCAMTGLSLTSHSPRLSLNPPLQLHHRSQHRLFSWVYMSQAKFYRSLNCLPLSYDVHPHGRADDRRACCIHERGASAGQTRGV
jgi:hypothetical protein